MTERPGINEWCLRLADVVSQRGTCPRRKVGCILVNSLDHIIGTGYNGVARGLHHCEGAHECPGVAMMSGTGLDACQAIHAEQNALLQCRNVQEIEAAFVTVSPCMTCAKLLLNTSCKLIVFRNEYANAEAVKNLWLSSGRDWVQLTSDNDIGTDADLKRMLKYC